MRIYVAQNTTEGDALQGNIVGIRDTLDGAKEAVKYNAAIHQDGRGTVDWECKFSDTLWLGTAHTATYKIFTYEVGSDVVINDRSRGSFTVSFPADQRADAELWPELYAHITRAHPITEFKPQQGQGQFQLPPMSLDDINFIRQILESEQRYARARSRKESGSSPGNELAVKSRDQFNDNVIRLNNILRKHF